MCHLSTGRALYCDALGTYRIKDTPPPPPELTSRNDTHSLQGRASPDGGPPAPNLPSHPDGTCEWERCTSTGKLSCDNKIFKLYTSRSMSRNDLIQIWSNLFVRINHLGTCKFTQEIKNTLLFVDICGLGFKCSVKRKSYLFNCNNLSIILHISCFVYRCKLQKTDGEKAPL